MNTCPENILVRTEYKCEDNVRKRAVKRAVILKLWGRIEEEVVFGLLGYFHVVQVQVEEECFFFLSTQKSWLGSKACISQLMTGNRIKIPNICAVLEIRSFDRDYLFLQSPDLNFPLGIYPSSSY